MKKNSLFIPIRVKSNKLDNYPIVSGQLFFVLDTQEIYLDCTIDNELKRILFVAQAEDENIFPKTTAIDFNEDGFDLTYSLKDKSILNNFMIYKDEEGNITDIYNQTTGENIDIRGLDINDDSSRPLTSEEIYDILNSVG